MLILLYPHQIKIITKSAVKSVDTSGKDCKVTVAANSDGKETIIECTKVLSAVGVSPNTENLGLEEVLDEKKSEDGFVQYLKQSEQLTVAEANKRFNSFLYNMVLETEENKMTALVSKSNRSSTEYPLTIDMLSKSLFSNFLYRNPLEEDMASIHYKRDQEVENIIQLFNIIYEEALHSWDDKKNPSDTNQNKLSRIFRSKSIMSWSEILKDAIAAKLDIIDADEKAMVFYRELSAENFNKIRGIVRRLIEWSIWTTPQESDIDRILADNKKEIKKFMKEKGLTAGYLMGAPE